MFFSSSFANLFEVQNQATNRERQFAINEIIRSKLDDLELVMEEENPGNPIDNWIISYGSNGTEKPASYIGKYTPTSGPDKLVFKDLIPFTKIDVVGANWVYPNNNPSEFRRANDGASTSSLVAKNVTSFLDSTFGSGKQIIVSPSTNEVLVCENFSDCSSPLQLNLPPLSNPTDIAENESNDRHIYISDSGNNRIIHYDLGTDTATVLGVPLEYPTGLSHYKDADGEYLFVAETLGNRITKINLSDESYEVVIGNGGETKCDDNTAKFCELNMPTGIFLDQVGNTLYVADSGNHRILRMTDPGTADQLPLIQLNLQIMADTKLSKIDFEFPAGSQKVENIQGVNTLHKGKILDPANPANVMSYELKTQLIDSIFTTCPPVPPGCTPKFMGFRVNASDNIFEIGDSILINNDPHIVQGVNTGVTPNEITVQDQTQDYGYVNAEVKIDNTFTAIGSPYQFDLDFSALNPGDIPAGIHHLTIKFYDDTGAEITTPGQTQYFPLRVGDGKLGSSEDLIERVAWYDEIAGTSHALNDLEVEEALGSQLIFPTGITDRFFTSLGSGGGYVFDRQSLNPINTSLNPINPNYFQPVEYDYISDFNLGVAGVEFQKLNSDKLLEVSIEAQVDQAGNVFETYKLNHQLP